MSNEKLEVRVADLDREDCAANIERGLDDDHLADVAKGVYLCTRYGPSTEARHD